MKLAVGLRGALARAIAVSRLRLATAIHDALGLPCHGGLGRWGLADGHRPALGEGKVFPHILSSGTRGGSDGVRRVSVIQNSGVETAK